MGQWELWVSGVGHPEQCLWGEVAVLHPAASAAGTLQSAAVAIACASALLCSCTGKGPRIPTQGKQYKELSSGCILRRYTDFAVLLLHTERQAAQVADGCRLGVQAVP